VIDSGEFRKSAATSADHWSPRSRSGP